MKIGIYDIGREEVSIALMILFAMAAMFFMGYKLAYTNAVTDANIQMVENIHEYKETYGFIQEPAIFEINGVRAWEDEDEP